MLAIWSASEPTSDAKRIADQAEADPPRQRPRQLVAERPAVGPRTPRTAAGSAGSERPAVTPEVAAREELDADRQEDDPDDPTSARDGQS